MPPSVTTPIDPPAGAPTRLATGSDPTRTQSLILLADDNAANVAVLRDYLPTVGYRVVVAQDGMEIETAPGFEQLFEAYAISTPGKTNPRRHIIGLTW